MKRKHDGDETAAQLGADTSHGLEEQRQCPEKAQHEQEPEPEAEEGDRNHQDPEPVEHDEVHERGLHVHTIRGSDFMGNGSAARPYKSVGKALRMLANDPAMDTQADDFDDDLMHACLLKVECGGRDCTMVKCGEPKCEQMLCLDHGKGRGYWSDAGPHGRGEGEGCGIDFRLFACSHHEPGPELEMGVRMQGARCRSIYCLRHAGLHLRQCGPCRETGGEGADLGMYDHADLGPGFLCPMHAIACDKVVEKGNRKGQICGIVCCNQCLGRHRCGSLEVVPPGRLSW